MRLTDCHDGERLQRGEYEAELLDALGADCYAATSSRFYVSRCGHGFHRPFGDESRLELSQVERPSWPGNAPFAVCLTHDVDNVSRNASRIHLRRLLRQIRLLPGEHGRRAMRTTRSTLLALLASLRRGDGDDPLHAYERWLRIEQQVGAKSTFLFLPDRYHQPHYSDGGYRYHDRVRFDGQQCSVAEMMGEIHRRGWEVGLHASWQAAASLDELRRQRDQVERVIESPVFSVRHHNLHFDVRTTARLQQAAGFRADSSLGFNDDVGFRRGTCYPFRLHDLSEDRPLDVLELPLIIQDKCLLLSVGNGSIDWALQWARLLGERVSRVGGVLTVLWHPGVISDPKYVNLYEQLLCHLAEAGAWFGTMRQVAEHWQQARHRHLSAAERTRAG